jgi:hypothetical protein
MFNEALQAIGPLPVAVGILLLLVTATYTHRLPPSKIATAGNLGPDPETLQIPPSISSSIPYIGHVLGYVRDGHSYFSSLWYDHPPQHFPDLPQCSFH